MRRQLGELAEIGYGSSPNEVRTDFSNYPMFGTGGQVGFATEPLFEAPLIVVARKGTLDKPSYVKKDCWVIDTAYAVQPKEGTDAKWLYYNLDNFNLASLNEATGVPSISRDYLRQVEFDYFEEKEQQKIAKILTTVDNLIEKTEALIEKYQAIKQGMMHDLFTRGIDTNGQLRPSYHDAPHLYKQTELGWIPKEWDVLQIGLALEKGMITLIQDGNHGESYPRSSDFAEYGVPFISAKHITKTGAIDFQSCPKLPHNYLSKLRIGFGEPGDVVFAHNATVGPVGIVKENVNFIASTSTTIYRTDSKTILNGFLYYQLKSPLFQEQIQRVMGQTTRNQVPITEQKGQWMVLMSKEEQKQIQITLEKLDAVYEKELSFYKKHSSVKKGLMQDLLTGEVKVKING